MTVRMKSIDKHVEAGRQRGWSVEDEDYVTDKISVS
jgi:hypothetical protein